MNENNGKEGFFCHRKPDITYPCSWEYKVIGADREKLMQVITAACEPARPAISLSNLSSGGRYCSLNVTLQVASEEMRDAIFKRINSDPAVKMVI